MTHEAVLNLGLVSLDELFEFNQYAAENGGVEQAIRSLIENKLMIPENLNRSTYWNVEFSGDISKIESKLKAIKEEGCFESLGTALLALLRTTAQSRKKLVDTLEEASHNFPVTKKNSSVHPLPGADRQALQSAKKPSDSIYKCSECRYQNTTFIRVKWHQYMHHKQKMKYKERKEAWPSSSLEEQQMEMQFNVFESQITGYKTVCDQTGNLKSRSFLEDNLILNCTEEREDMKSEPTLLMYKPDSTSDSVKCNGVPTGCNENISSLLMVKEVKPYLCTKCNLSFCSLEDLNQHQGMVKSKRISFYCQACNYESRKPSDFKRHKSTIKHQDAVRKMMIEMDTSEESAEPNHSTQLSTTDTIEQSHGETVVSNKKLDQPGESKDVANSQQDLRVEIHDSEGHVVTDSEGFIHCTHCAYVSKRLKVFRAHQKIHEDPAGKVVNQGYSEDFDGFCDDRLKRPEDSWTAWARGISSAGMLIKKDMDGFWHCEKCPYMTKRLTDVKRHQAIHANGLKKARKRRCKHCSFVCFGMLHMKRHIIKHCLNTTSPLHETQRTKELDGCTQTGSSPQQEPQSNKDLDIQSQVKHYASATKTPLDKNDDATTVQSETLDVNPIKKSRHGHVIDEHRWIHCHQCVYVSRRASDVKRHELVHGKEKPKMKNMPRPVNRSKTLKCALRDFKGAYQSVIKRQQDRHLQDEELSPGTPRYETCLSNPDCKAGLTEKSWPRQCPKPNCQYVAHRLSAFNSHLSRRHGEAGVFVEPPHHVCEQCGKMYKSLSSFRDHQAKEHGKKGRFACGVCGKQFINRVIYKGHCDKHLGVKPFPCQYCGQRYLYRSGMLEHEKACCGKYSFQCQLCDKVFTRHRTLREHVKASHKTEAPLSVCS